MRPYYKIIDLFCGCGGASVGVKNGGHSVVAAVDIDPVACSTYSRYLGLDPICGDLNDIDGQTILDHYGLRKEDVDIVIGCPPCQGFSSLKRTTGRDASDARNGLIEVFLKRLKELEPRRIIFENVSGIHHSTNRYYLNYFVRSIQNMGYCFSYDFLLDAADYGVPQHRKRVMIIATKELVKSQAYLSPEHPDETQKTAKRYSMKTVRNAIGDLAPLENGEAHPSIPNHKARLHTEKVLKVIKSIPKDGGGRKSLPKDLWLPCHKKIDGGATTAYGRMRWDLPAPTITSRCTSPSCGRFLHPDQDRSITIREAARLQTFPDDFIFPSSVAESEKLIGNAVPPLLIEGLMDHFNRYI